MVDGGISLFVIVLLALLGMVLGSFAGAMVWRLRVRQLAEDKQAGIKISKKDSADVSKIKSKSLADDRSVCLHCGHKLAWYDLVPLASWLYLSGRCRYCRHRIGWLEPVIELGLATFFVASYVLWPSSLDSTMAIVQFCLWLCAGVGLAILTVYDAKWFLLPDPVMYILIAVAGSSAMLVYANSGFSGFVLLDIALAVATLSGLYYVIYIISNHQWIGFGDVKLGLALALLLADWKLAILALFLANAIGTIILLPMMLRGKVKRQSHIPFGPLLIAGWFLAGLFGQQIIDWYLSISLV